MTFTCALLLTLLVHVIDDFGVQQLTHLDELKQKQWWIEQCFVAKKYGGVDTSMYRYDYIACLVLHAFKWSCMVLLPGILALGLPPLWLLLALVFGNTLVHALVDDLKANKHKLNLVQD